MSLPRRKALCLALVFASLAGSCSAAAPAQITFKMPASVTYGWLVVIDWAHSYGCKKLSYIKQLPVRESTTIAADQKYLFSGTGHICQDPSLLQNLPVQSIYGLVFDHTDLDNSAAPFFKRFKNASIFSVEETDIGDEVVETIADMPHLKRLILDRTTISGKNLQLVSKLKELEFLSLSNNLIATANIKYIANLPRLQKLDLRRLRLTDQDLCQVKNLPSLQQLRLNENESLTDKCLPALQKLPALTDLDIVRTNITVAGLIKNKLPKLKRVSMRKGQYTKADNALFMSAYPAALLCPSDDTHSADVTVFSPLH